MVAMSASLWQLIPWYDVPSVVVFCLFVVGYLYNGSFFETNGGKQQKKQQHEKLKRVVPEPTGTPVLLGGKTTSAKRGKNELDSVSSPVSSLQWLWASNSWLQDKILPWNLPIVTTKVKQTAQQNEVLTDSSPVISEKETCEPQAQEDAQSLVFLISNSQTMTSEETKLQHLCLRAMDQSTREATTETTTLEGADSIPTTRWKMKKEDNVVEYSCGCHGWHQQISARLEKELQLLEQIIESPDLAHPTTQHQAQVMRILLYKNLPRIYISGLRWYQRASELLMDVTFCKRRLDVLVLGNITKDNDSDDDGRNIICEVVQQMIDDCQLLQIWAHQGLAALPMSVWTVSHSVIGNWLEDRYHEVIMGHRDTVSRQGKHGCSTSNKVLAALGRAWFILSMSLLRLAREQRDPNYSRTRRKTPLTSLEEQWQLAFDYLDRAREVQSLVLERLLWFVTQGLYNVAKLEQDCETIQNSKRSEDLLQASSDIRQSFMIASNSAATRNTGLLMALSSAILVVYEDEATRARSTGWLSMVPFFNIRGTGTTKRRIKKDLGNHASRVLPIYRHRLHQRLNEAYDVCIALFDTCHQQCHYYYCDTPVELEHLNQLAKVLQVYRLYTPALQQKPVA
jgi:hypothetical protein